MALDFELSTTGLTAAFVTKLLSYLYMEAAEELGMEEYDSSSEVIDNYKVKRIIMQDASEQLNNWNQIVQKNDYEKKKPKLTLSNEAKYALHRKKGVFEQFDVIQRYSE